MIHPKPGAERGAAPKARISCEPAGPDGGMCLSVEWDSPQGDSLTVTGTVGKGNLSSLALSGIFQALADALPAMMNGMDKAISSELNDAMKAAKQRPMRVKMNHSYKSVVRACNVVASHIVTMGLYEDDEASDLMIARMSVMMKAGDKE